MIYNYSIVMNLLVLYFQSNMKCFLFFVLIFIFSVSCATANRNNNQQNAANKGVYNQNPKELTPRNIEIHKNTDVITPNEQGIERPPHFEGSYEIK